MSEKPSLSARARSASSLRFEKVVLATLRTGEIPRLADVDLEALGAYSPMMALIDPDTETRTLRLNMAGDGLSKFIGHDLTGLDYLDLVDPAIRGDAYDSAFLMLSRPCGLWQITPALMNDGSTIKVEYTGFPVFDEVRGRGQVIFLIVHAIPDVGKAPGIRAVQHATEWHWIELKNA